MKRCKDKACVKWEALDELKHALNGDLQVVNGLELTIRQSWFKEGCKGDLEPIMRVLNGIRWKLQDRVEQVNDIVTENI